MKAKIKTKSRDVSFAPFKVEILITSKEDLLDLLFRCNVLGDEITKTVGHSSVRVDDEEYVVGDNDRPLFEALSKRASKLYNIEY